MVTQKLFDFPKHWDRPRREISAISSVSYENEEPYTGTQNLSLNNWAVRFGNNSTDKRNRSTHKTPRPSGQVLSYTNRTPSPCTRTVSFNGPTSPFQINRSPSPFQRERSVSRDRAYNRTWSNSYDRSFQNNYRPTTPIRNIPPPQHFLETFWDLHIISQQDIFNQIILEVETFHRFLVVVIVDVLVTFNQNAKFHPPQAGTASIKK